MVTKFSETGRYHLGKNQENQDCLITGSNQDFFVVSLTDGVSTCRNAKAGAEIAGRAIVDLFLKKGNYFLDLNCDRASEFIISHILFRLKDRAKKDKHPVQEYASTVACVLFDKKNEKIMLFNLGDGIILGVSDGEYRILSEPFDSSDGGCCVTTTPHAERMTDIQVLDDVDLNSLMICSDGAWKNMFLKGRIKPEVENMVVNDQTDDLKEYLRNLDCYDDCSFISIFLQGGELEWMVADG